MKHFFLVTLMILILPAAALAQAPATGNLTAEEVPDWSMGAGFTYVSSGSLASYSGYSGYLYNSAPQAPTGNMALEHRLSDSLWLTLGFSGRFSQNEMESVDAMNLPYITSVIAGEVAVGSRYVFNPGKAIELSLFAGVSFLYGSVEAENNNATAASDVEVEKQRQFALGLKGGFAAERMLMKNLYLRIFAEVGGIYYGTLKIESTTAGGVTTTDTSSTLSGGISFTPGIQLRLLF